MLLAPWIRLVKLHEVVFIGNGQIKWIVESKSLTWRLRQSKRIGQWWSKIDFFVAILPIPKWYILAAIDTDTLHVPVVRGQRDKVYYLKLQSDTWCAHICRKNIPSLCNFRPCHFGVAFWSRVGFKCGFYSQ